MLYLNLDTSDAIDDVLVFEPLFNVIHRLKLNSDTCQTYRMDKELQRSALGQPDMNGNVQELRFTEMYNYTINVCYTIGIILRTTVVRKSFVLEK